MLPGETIHSGAPKPEGQELEVLHTPAGYYLGYLDTDGSPYSRETYYFETEADANDTLTDYQRGGPARDAAILLFWRT